MYWFSASGRRRCGDFNCGWRFHKRQYRRDRRWVWKNYPGIVKAIHQENGGHGEAVNAGLRNATGVYYKVVDSDDWVDVDVYLDIIKTLKELVAGPQTVDMFISNFVYDKAGAKHKKWCGTRHFLKMKYSSGIMQKTAHRTLHSDAFRDLPYHAATGMQPGASKHTFTWTICLCSSRFRM